MTAHQPIRTDRLGQLGQILRQRSLTWDELREMRALHTALLPERLARMFAEMPRRAPQHDAHVRLWQARKRADDAVRGLIGDFDAWWRKS